MLRIPYALPIITLSLLLLTGCKDGKITLRSFDGNSVVTMNVEFADTPQERSRGLMGRETLDPEGGMLFVFPEPQVLKFWMKNTLIPLEILYFDANGDFVNARDMVPCKEDPCEEFASAALSQYALEVTPGFRQKHGIGVGWKLDLKTVQKNSRPK